MTAVVAEDAGKWIQLQQSCKDLDTFQDEYVLGLQHKAQHGRSSGDRTDVAVFWDDSFFDAAKDEISKADGTRSLAELVEPHARLIVDDVPNKDLSAIIGTRVWKDLFRSPTGHIDVSAVSSTGPTGHEPLLSKQFRGSLVVVESGIVESGIKENGIVEVGPSAYFFEKSHTPKPQQKFAFDEEEFVKKVKYSIEVSFYLHTDRIIYLSIFCHNRD